MVKIGVIVNPIAGLGGPLGLGGSDSLSWLVSEGVRGPSYKRSVAFLSFLRRELIAENPGLFKIITGQGLYGQQSLLEARIEPDVVLACESDARLCSRELSEKLVKEGADLIIFFGGDGTAFDVAVGSRKEAPIVGVPSGTKMYNSIFVLSEHHLLELISLFIEGGTELTEREVFLIDEELLKMGIYKVIERAYCKTIYSGRRAFFQESKELAPPSDEEELEGIAKYLEEEYGFPSKGSWIIGPGRTLQALLKFHGYDKGFLGFMGLVDGRVWCYPCSSEDIMRILAERVDTRVVLTPVGGSGFLIGRGNKELTPGILKIVAERKMFLVVATKDKLRKLKHLLVDTGSEYVDSMFEGYVKAVVGYYEELVTKVLSSSKADNYP